jgi:hypothetical protein
MDKGKRQTIQWTKEKEQTTIYKTKDRVRRTPLKTRCEVRWSGRVSSSCSTSGTHRFTLTDDKLIDVYLQILTCNPEVMSLFYSACNST